MNRTLFRFATLAFTLGIAPGCSSAPAVDCGTVDVPSYKDMTVWNNCTGCHSSELSGASRASAPEGINFDTYEDAAAEAMAAADEVARGAMPPGGALSQADQDLINAWAQCGTPE